MRLNQRQHMNEDFDAALETRSQQMIRQAVKSLPEESLSLEWRSRLNERLRASVVPRSRWIWSRIWQPALGLVMASCLAMVVTLRVMEPERAAPQPNLEAALVSSHTELSRMQDVTGSGLGAYELSETTATTTDADLWEVSEFSSL